MFSYDDIFATKHRILFVTAHPDDAIAFFGGLIARLIQDGKEVFVLLATNGARGSRENTISESELAYIRLNEEAAALSVLGVPDDHLFCLHHLDGEMESDMSLIGEVAKYIRAFRADMVCTHEPSIMYTPTSSGNGYVVQHRDHRKIGEAVMDAAYPFSRDRSFFPEHYIDGIQPHTVKDILFTDEKTANFECDFTEFADLKREALRQHVSQFDEATIERIVTRHMPNGRNTERFNYVHLAW